MKIKLKIEKLDVIAEASLRLEDSYIFTSIEPNSNKYFVSLVETAWLNHKSRQKSRSLRNSLKKLPYECRISYIELDDLRKQNHKIDKEIPKAYLPILDK